MTGHVRLSPGRTKSSEITNLESSNRSPLDPHPGSFPTPPNSRPLTTIPCSPSSARPFRRNSETPASETQLSRICACCFLNFSADNPHRAQHAGFAHVHPRAVNLPLSSQTKPTYEQCKRKCPLVLYLSGLPLLLWCLPRTSRAHKDSSYRFQQHFGLPTRHLCAY